MYNLGSLWSHTNILVFLWHESISQCTFSSKFVTFQEECLIIHPSSDYFLNSELPEHKCFTSKLTHALPRMHPQCNSYSFSHMRIHYLRLWPFGSEVPGFIISSQNRSTPQSISRRCRTDYTFTGRWRRKQHDMTPSNKKRPRFPLLFLKFLFSHGPLALLLPLSKPFLKVSTEYLISFSVKSSSLLDFWSKVSADPNTQESQHFFFQKKKKVKPLSMGECTG